MKVAKITLDWYYQKLSLEFVFVHQKLIGIQRIQIVLIAWVIVYLANLEMTASNVSQQHINGMLLNQLARDYVLIWINIIIQVLRVVSLALIQIVLIAIWYLIKSLIFIIVQWMCWMQKRIFMELNLNEMFNSMSIWLVLG